MKKVILSLIALCAALVSPVNAQENPLKLFSGVGTATSATLSTFIASANGEGNPRVQYINATCDNATNTIRCYNPTNRYIVGIATNSGQAIIYASNNITGTPILVLRHRADDSYEYLVTSSVTVSNITATGNTAKAIVAGDIVYAMQLQGNIPVGNATKELNAMGGAFFNGSRGNPILLTSSGASATTINAVSGVYQP